jgi:putative ABC transport system substrate-binding protein
MKRREFFSLVGGVVAASSAFPARAQQPAMPVVGFLRNTDAASSDQLVSAFRKGLGENGYVEGRNVAIEYRWAENHDDRLPALAADLVRRNVAAIVAGGGAAVAVAATAATKSIPIVFELGGDPVKMGLIPSLNHPGGNATGVALFANVVGPKRIEFLLDLVPKATAIGVLMNPESPVAKGEVEQLQRATQTLGIRLDILKARTRDEFDLAFQTLHRSSAQALIILANPLVLSGREQLVALAARYAIPVIYPFPNFVKAGGLMSYGDSLAEAFRQLGIYTARILNGEKPADLPVMQSTKFELAINLRTAKALGLTVPSRLLVAADDVIE